MRRFASSLREGFRVWLGSADHHLRDILPADREHLKPHTASIGDVNEAVIGNPHSVHKIEVLGRSCNAMESVDCRSGTKSAQRPQKGGVG